MNQVPETRVLLIEDSDIDALLLERELEKAELNPIVTRVETKDDLIRKLSEKEFDVVISDYVLPQFNGLEALALVREKSAELPFILVSGRMGEELAVEAIKNGSNDYIMKANLFRLGMAVKRAMNEAYIQLERKKAEEELARSLSELKKKTRQLAESNQKMHLEMEARRKAQTEVSNSREHLKRVIDSAPELIFSVDKNLRISTWNKSLQDLTGFSEKDVLNRNIEKLQAFLNAKELLNPLGSGNLIPSERMEFPLTTKDNVKKVVQAAGSILRGASEEEQGTLFIGKDITPFLEEHGRLLEGMGYLIKDRGINSSLDLFLSLTRANRRGLLVTRAHPNLISSWLPSSSNIEVMTLSVQSFRGENEISRSALRDMVDKIVRFASADDPSVILLDGGHYFIATLGFSQFLDMIFQLTEALFSKRSMFLLRVDPNLFDEERMAFLENELLILPSQKIEGVVIEDELYALLRFIQEQNQNNSVVSLKKISAKFQISHVTVAKRVESLEQDGLIYVRKMGKQRAPFLTEKGKALLAQRRTI